MFVKIIVVLGLFEKVFKDEVFEAKNSRQQDAQYKYVKGIIRIQTWHLSGWF